MVNILDIYSYIFISIPVWEIKMKEGAVKENRKGDRHEEKYQYKK